MLRRLVSGVLLALLAFAQQAGQPVFEVASVKPSKSDHPPRVAGGPGTASRERWSCFNCSLHAVLTHAYAVFSHQLDEPQWTRTAVFDVIANVPLGATRDEFRLMLQSLLQERFKMKAHRENREMPVYELVIAKGGPKLQEVKTPAPPSPPGPAVDQDGYPNVPGGTGIRLLNGLGRMQFRGQIMKNLAAQYLSSLVDRPVLDATGLKGMYAFTLSWRQVRANATTPDTDSVLGPTIFDALEEQLGLKLMPKKGAVETIVIDHLEKTPTEN